jgi:hypothetical protein
MPRKRLADRVLGARVGRLLGLELDAGLLGDAGR